MSTEIVNQIVNVWMDSGKILIKNAKNVVTNVLLVPEMLITVLHVTVSEIQSMTAHAQ
jgi:hypothetical protein